MMITPSIVLFAIQSTLKMSSATRQSYVESIRRSEITLPLPNFSPDTSVLGTRQFYANEYEISDNDPPELKNLVRQLKSTQTLTPEQEKTLLSYFLETQILDSTETNLLPDTNLGYSISGNTLNNLVTIRQWSRQTDPTISVFKRLSGTFLEIGVDYFAHSPNGLNIDSREGIALHALFSSLDTVKFSEDSWNNNLRELPRRFSIALLETISDSSDIFSEDPNTQRLIEVTAISLSNNVEQHFQQIQQHHESGQLSASSALNQRNKLISWSELIFRSILQSAGRMVSEDPATYLGIDDEANATFIEDISTALLDVIANTAEGKLGKAFGKNSLSSIVNAALGAVSKYPELVTNNKHGLKLLIAQIAEELSSLNLINSHHILPEAMRLIIQISGENLEALWPDSGNNPKQRVLMMATKDLLMHLSQAPTHTATWKLTFTKENITSMLDTALYEVANNPAWILDKANNESQYLSTALDAMLSVLRTTADHRISTSSATKLIQTGLRAAAVRMEFLDKLPNGNQIIGEIFDTVLSLILKQDQETKAAWRLARGDILIDIMKITLKKLESTKIEKNQINSLKTVLTEQINQINNGEPWNLQHFAKAFENALDIHHEARLHRNQTA